LPIVRTVVASIKVAKVGLLVSILPNVLILRDKGSGIGGSMYCTIGAIRGDVCISTQIIGDDVGTTEVVRVGVSMNK
jgi:hypothetical protein